MDLYVKPTSKHQYLHNKSCHPKHCKTAIPYSQALTIKRICSERENLLLRTNDLKHHLSEREYPEQLLDLEINPVINTSGSGSPSPNNQRNLNRVPLVVAYHPNLPTLEQTIRCYHRILQDLERLQEAIPSLPIIAFRRLRTYTIYCYERLYLSKKMMFLATFAARLEGARPSPYWSPLIRSPAVWLVSILNESCMPPAKRLT